jgi:hypothetical protein
LITSGFSIQAREIEMVNGVETVKVVRSSSIVIKLLICIGISALLFYVNLWNILGLKAGGKKIKIAGQSVLALTLAISTYYLLDHQNMLSASPPLPTSLSWGTIIFYFTISVAYGLGKVWIYVDRLQQKLALEKKQAELTLLRNQLHPHFLFNVLNNLLAMVDQQQNPLLADSLDRLSRLLRYVVYDMTAKAVPVKKEIDFIRNFAELQLLRFEQDEVKFVLEIAGDYDQQLVEPGIFVPFMENAFKYGAEPERYSEIKVRFDLSEKSKIKFSVTNPVFPLMQNRKGTGTGILSTKERLNLVYPNRHQLQITENEFFQVVLNIGTHAHDHSR